MTTLISEVDFKEWKIYALHETDYLSTYIFSHVDNDNLKYGRYMVITFSEVEWWIESWSSSYDLREINWYLELDSMMDPWMHFYNEVEAVRNDIYWDEYKKADPNFEPTYDQEDAVVKILATVNANQRFKKDNFFGIHSLDTEKKEYSFNGSTIKLKPCEDDLKYFNCCLKEALKKENKDE